MTLVLNGTTGVSSVDGSASTPAVQGTDTNTGMFFPAADTVAVATGGSERVRVDSSGNVGVGTSSPGTRLDVQQSTTSVLAQFKNTSSSNQNGNVSAVNDAGTAIRIQVFGSAAGSYGMLSASSPAIYTSASELNFAADNASGVIKFSTGSSVPERARIDSSGNLLVGKTVLDSTTQGVVLATGGGVSRFTRNGGAACIFVGNSSQNVVEFNNGTTTVGSISITGSTTAYNTSSDYRLKDNIQPMTGALAKVAALKPCTYKWKATGEKADGFIAHELAEVCPGAVTGEKDAVNEDGSIKPQGIDTSFLVATLTAAIQELNAKVESLTAEIATLKGAQA